MDILEYGRAICYSGYREGQNPKGEVPTKEQIAEDLDILVRDGYRYIRMYDPNLHARRVLETIREKHLPLQCIIGIDSDNEVNNAGCPFEDQHFTEDELRQHAARNDAEAEKLIELVKEFPEAVAAVSIGNENTPPWGAHMVPEERLIQHARRFHEALDKPVTFCEGYFEWPHIPALAKELDFISVHSYPYHYGTRIEDAVAQNKQHYADMKAMFPDKQVIFTELGWSSDTAQSDIHAISEDGEVTENPEAKKAERATLANAKRYIEELTAWITEEKVIAFIFEAFDELWKGPQKSSSECNFGLYNEERQKKW